MSARGSVYSWCGCRDPATGGRLGSRCPYRYVFTCLNGDPMAPDRLSRTFRRLCDETGLPPVGCTTCGTARPPSHWPPGRT